MPFALKFSLKLLNMVRRTKLARISIFVASNWVVVFDRSVNLHVSIEIKSSHGSKSVEYNMMIEMHVRSETDNEEIKRHKGK